MMRSDNLIWKVPVLYYHHVGEISYYTCIHPREFSRQLEWIRSKYEIISVYQAIQLFESNRDARNKVVLTFDDGYEDNFTEAAPILRELQANATFFILPGYVGTSNAWNLKAPYRCNHLNYDQILSLLSHGFDIGSHGLTHAPLDQMTTDRIEEELHQSKFQIANLFGIASTSFAYPYGRFDDRCISAAANSYKLSFSTIKSSEVDWINNPHALRRIYLQTGLTKEEIFEKIRTY